MEEHSKLCAILAFSLLVVNAFSLLVVNDASTIPSKQREPSVLMSLVFFD